MNTVELKEIARNIRTTVIEAVHAAGSGHPGGSLSAADIMTVLYFDEMNIEPKIRRWMKEIDLYFQRVMQHLYFMRL